MKEVQIFIINKIKKELNNILLKEQIDKILEIVNTKPLDIWNQENNILIEPFISIITDNGKYNNVINNAREIVKAYYQLKPVLTENKDKKLLELIIAVQKLGPYLQLKLEQVKPNLNSKCTKKALEELIDTINKENITYLFLKKLLDLNIINENEYKENLSIINTCKTNPNSNIIEAMNQEETKENKKQEPKKEGNIIRIIMPTENNEEGISKKNSKK